MTTPDLMRQILAAIEETERDAQAAAKVGGATWSVEAFTPSSPDALPAVMWVVDEAEDGMAMVNGDSCARHIARNDPASVLRRCAADRELVELLRDGIGSAETRTMEAYCRDALCLLADAYDIHPNPEPGSPMANDLAEAPVDTVPVDVLVRDLAERAAAAATVHQEED